MNPVVQIPNEHPGAGEHLPWRYSDIGAIPFSLRTPFSVAGRFNDLAASWPARPALIVPGRDPVSYDELAGRMGGIREVLRREGVRPDDVVGVAMDNPVDWVPTLLAILAEGAVYVVLDAGLPDARLRILVEDSTASIVLCGVAEVRRLEGVLPEGVRRVVPGTWIANASRTSVIPRTEDSIAFLTYTSGSTGAPKGIALRHVNILHEVSVHVETLGLTPDDRMTGLYPPSTAGCTRDLYAALLTGASIGFFPFRDLGLAALREWIRGQRFTRYHSVPPIFRELMQESGSLERLPDLRTVFLAGDRVAWSDLDLQRANTAPECRFYTGIGTSETSSLYAHGFVDPGESRADPVLPSGVPVPGVIVRLLNPSGNPAAPGEAGEIVVEGRWLAAGYWSRELRAAQPFPSVEGAAVLRRHRTGDFATWDHQGRLRFQGRRDQQVKILGNRIDLSEVDLHLRQMSGAREVAVRVMAPSGGAEIPVLTAFVAWNGIAPALADIHRHLRAHLPAPAVPSRFHWLQEFPRLANGKLDARELDRLAVTRPPETGSAAADPAQDRARSESALPAMGGLSGRPLERTIDRPMTAEEERMLRVWRESLGMETVGIHDDFFEMGGHSLLALRLVTALRGSLGVELTLADLFANPNVAALAKVPGHHAGETPPASSGGLRSRGFRGRETGTPWIHVPGYHGIEFLPPSLAAVVGRHRPFHDGLQFPGVDGQSAPERTVAGIASALVSQVEALCPAGPFWLSGYSMGGFVAHELAQQLAERGRPVERVVVFDTRYLRESRQIRLAERVNLMSLHLRDRSWTDRIRWAVHLMVSKVRRCVWHWMLRRGWGATDPKVRIEAAGWAALASHTPRPYGGAVTLLRATRLEENDTARLECDAWNGWRRWTHPGFEVVNLDCNHRSVCLEPVEPAVLDAIESLLVRTDPVGPGSGRP